MPGRRVAGLPEDHRRILTNTGGLGFDVTAAVQQLTADHQSSWTVAIAPDSENEKLYRHHFANNPSITTEYDITPSVWYSRTSPAPGFADTGGQAACTSGGASPWDNPGWVGNNQNIYLSVNSWSPAGFNLYTGFHLWDDNDAGFHLYQDAPWAGSYNEGTTIAVGSLTDGHQYGWRAAVTDGTLTSAESPWCYFRVDRTNPTAAITSTDFPPSGTPNDHPSRYNTDAGRFVLTGTDPAPGNGLNASGLACFRVSIDPTPVTGWRCDDPNSVRPDASGQFSFTHVPGRWGTNLLYAQAQDRAGNYSQVAVYRYYAPWKPGTPQVFGDVDGDLVPDILLPDSAGNLRTIGGNTDPTRASSVPAGGAPVWTSTPPAAGATTRSPTAAPSTRALPWTS